MLHHPWKMAWNEFDYEELTKTLTDNFNILADDVQLLSDQKTIPEHTLRFAHEQVGSALFSFNCHPLHMMKNLALDLELLWQRRATNTTCILI